MQGQIFDRASVGFNQMVGLRLKFDAISRQIEALRKEETAAHGEWADASEQLAQGRDAKYLISNRPGVWQLTRVDWFEGQPALWFRSEGNGAILLESEFGKLQAAGE